MNKRIKTVGIIGAILLLAVLGLIGYFGWRNIAQVDTMHAQIEAPMVPIRAPAYAKVVGLSVAVGDSVAEGEELGLLELAAADGARILRPIRAPQDGVIVERSIKVDQIVSAGQGMLTVADLDNLWVSANIHQSRVPQVEVGQLVRVKVKTRSWRRVFWGRVTQMGRATNAAVSVAGAPGAASAAAASVAQPAEVPVRISLDPAGYPLLPGMRADVRIYLAARGL